MEVKKGYKQTGVGIIPEDWDVGLIGDLAVKVGSGITPTGGERVYKIEGRPFIRSQNVGWGTLLLDDIAFIDEHTHSSFSATEILLNDVLLNITGASIGRSAVADKRIEGGNVNQHVCIIRVDTSRLSPRYINLFLLSQMGQRQIDSFQAGGNRQGLNFGQIKSFSFPFPPLSEQFAIAAAISDVDLLLTSLDAIITKKHLIKQGTMQELLTGKKRLPGFSDVWEVKTIEELAGGASNIVDGPFGSNLKNSDYIANGVPVLQGQNITGDKFIWKDVRYISDQKAKDLFRSNARVGDLLTVKIGSVGFSAPIDNLDGNDFAIIPANLLRTRIQNNNTDLFFMHHLLVSNFGKKKLQDLAGNTAQPAIGLSGFRKLSFAVPALKKEQIAIAEILSDMDAEIAALEQRREKTRLLKQGIMQELLTGRIRLI